MGTRHTIRQPSELSALVGRVSESPRPHDRYHVKPLTLEHRPRIGGSAVDYARGLLGELLLSLPIGSEATYDGAISSFSSKAGIPTAFARIHTSHSHSTCLPRTVIALDDIVTVAAASVKFEYASGTD
ncbi:hypothetical protein AZG88_02005 [Rhodococcus sp. LB1]|nr:hypothetical protein AZG88_02005 [Rhodococcus sp. LB1]